MARARRKCNSDECRRPSRRWCFAEAAGTVAIVLPKTASVTERNEAPLTATGLGRDTAPMMA